MKRLDKKTHLSKTLGCIIGCVSGYLLGGNIGYPFVGLLGLGILGTAVGFYLDITESMTDSARWDRGPSNEETDVTDFILGTLILSGIIAKADGSVDEMEVAYIRSFLSEQFGDINVDDYWYVFQETVDQEVNLAKIAQGVRRQTSYETRLQLLYLLFGIANADYNIDDLEIANIRLISLHFGLSPAEFESIKSMFCTEMDSNYKILEILPSVPDRAVKEAYRTMAQKYHPDKLGHLGDAVKRASTQKYLRVKDAYEAIREERGFS